MHLTAAMGKQLSDQQQICPHAVGNRDKLSQWTFRGCLTILETKDKMDLVPTNPVSPSAGSVQHLVTLSPCMEAIAWALQRVMLGQQQGRTFGLSGVQGELAALVRSRQSHQVHVVFEACHCCSG